jgi:hypothetical protein
MADQKRKRATAPARSKGSVPLDPQRDRALVRQHCEIDADRATSHLTQRTALWLTWLSPPARTLVLILTPPFLTAEWLTWDNPPARTFVLTFMVSSSLLDWDAWDCAHWEDTHGDSRFRRIVLHAASTLRCEALVVLSQAPTHRPSGVSWGDHFGIHAK